MSLTEGVGLTTPGPPPGEEEFSWDDGTWVILTSFIIFTMQTGFGLLEVGVVSPKNEVNILMKNVIDIILGGFSYWILGYSITFGRDGGSNGFVGVGLYAVDASLKQSGTILTSFIFQLSFATTATTIVSGAVAERCNYVAYALFSLLNTFTYVFPARWVWGPTGFLGEMGVIDIAGSGVVHLVGGASAMTAAWMVGPRLGRYEGGLEPLPLGNPSSCIYGLFNLWWGWLAFNAGSTYGVTGVKWKFAARAASTTMVAAMGGGIVGILYGYLRARVMTVMDVVNPVLGALVGITASCALVSTPEAFAIGVVGALVIILTSSFTDYLRIDDPVGATSVHGFGGIWGMIAVGFFTADDEGAGFVKGYLGLFHGGSSYLLGVQVLACVCIIAWASISTFIILGVINCFVRIRMSDHEQLLGADMMEHQVRRRGVGVSPAVSLYRLRPDVLHAQTKAQYYAAANTRHETVLAVLNDMKEFHSDQGNKQQWGDERRNNGRTKRISSITALYHKLKKSQRKGNVGGLSLINLDKGAFSAETRPPASLNESNGGGGNNKGRGKEYAPSLNQHLGIAPKTVNYFSF